MNGVIARKVLCKFGKHVKEGVFNLCFHFIHVKLKRAITVVMKYL
jgi:hypothetical protein